MGPGTCYVLAARPAPDLAAATPAGTRGLSFGLAIARSLVEAHGGSLRLEQIAAGPRGPEA